MNIIGIDPGNNTLGIAIINIDKKINTIETILLNIDNFIFEVYDPNYTEVENKTFIMCERLYKVIKYYNPSAIAIETPFFNRFKPSSYKSLLFLFNNIKNIIKKYNDNILIMEYSPLEIKSFVKANDFKDKNKVKLALFNIKEITNNFKELNIISEHEIDALAICYKLYKEITGDIDVV